MKLVPRNPFIKGFSIISKSSINFSINNNFYFLICLKKNPMLNNSHTIGLKIRKPIHLSAPLLINGFSTISSA
jgi:hypothetical protein